MNEFARFVIVGVANTVLGYATIFACMYLARWPPVASNVAGYSLGLVLAYVLHRTFTFGSSNAKATEIVRFLVVFGVAYGANLVALVMFYEVVGINPGVSQILAGVVYIALSYLLNRSIVFVRH